MREKISRRRAEIMGLCMVIVCFVHIFNIEDENSLLGMIHRFGFISVDTFVVLSMFGLYHSFEKNPVNSISSYLRYLGRRLLRLYVIFLPATAVIMLVDNWSILTFIRRILQIDQLTLSVYKHLWFITAILLFYIFAPFCYYLVKKVKTPPLLVIAVSVIVYAILISLSNYIRDDLNAILARIPDIFIGFMLATYDGSLSPKNKKIYSISIILMFILGVIIMYYEVAVGYFDVFYGDNIIHNTLTVSGFTIILAVIFDFLGSHRITRIINMTTAYLGAITLEIYCIHECAWAHIINLQIKESKRYLACLLIVFIGALGLNALGKSIRKLLAHNA